MPAARRRLQSGARFSLPVPGLPLADHTPSWLGATRLFVTCPYLFALCLE
jgi:hypothetical protein